MRGFTEAVPLSLSSMAHMTMPLEEGVVDGIRQVLQHTLLSCVNYARVMVPPSSWTFSDLGTSPFAWRSPSEASKVNVSTELPPALQKLGFQHVYPRTCFIYLKKKQQSDSGMPKTHAQEMSLVPTGSQTKADREWTHHPDILGKVCLLYATQELMTPGELSGTEGDEETPPCVLYKVAVEYRSLPATGNRAAVQAEELSMLSFGGSVDDDVKHGALAALYDPFAKYVLEIYSVRGKKYKFDLMDSTLSDGTVPRLPSKPARGAIADGERPTKKQAKEETTNQDPFVKSLCVTVTDHHEAQPPPPPQDESEDNSVKKDDDNSVESGKEADDAKNSVKDAKNDAKLNYAITRIHLTMEGQLRITDLKELPNFHSISETIQSCFLSLKARPPEMATCSPSGHTLLLDPKEAGRIYVHGRYVTTWGEDPRVGCTKSGPALFGMDLHSIPFWHGRIFDFDMLKRQYAQLWQEILIDARWMPLEIGSRLLARLSTGKDPPRIRAATRKRIKELEAIENAVDEDDDDDDEESVDDHGDKKPKAKKVKQGKEQQNGAASNGSVMNHRRSSRRSSSRRSISRRSIRRGDISALISKNISSITSSMNDDSNNTNNNDHANNDTNAMEEVEEEEEEDDDDDDETADTGMDCLETQVMQSLHFDPVGISAKALATRFKMEHGPAAFPCQAYEVEWVKDRLPHRTPTVVPARVITILRRGGYFDAQRTGDEVWFAESRKAQGPKELTLIRMALTKLIDAGVTDVSLPQIVFAKEVAKSIPDPLATRHGIVRRNPSMRQYHVHEGFLTIDLGGQASRHGASNDDDDPNQELRAYLLGFHIAQEHPDGNVLTRYLIRNKR